MPVNVDCASRRGLGTPPGERWPHRRARVLGRADACQPAWAACQGAGSLSSVPSQPLSRSHMQPRNLAARAGRWSATHRKTAVIGWILFVVLATIVGGKVGQKNLEPSAMGNGESKRGQQVVADAGFPETIGERVLIQGKGSIESGDPAVTAAVKDVVSRLGRI